MVQVAGDDKGRIFQVTGESPNSSGGQTSGPAAGASIVEAYHWGHYTSGSWSQGLWFVLVPFGILNAAQFMLPRPADNDRYGRVLHTACGAMLRLVSLCLTGVFAFTAAYVLADIVAWQKFPEWITGIDSSVWRVFGRVIPLHELVVAAALILATALIVVLSWLAGRGASRESSADELKCPESIGSDTLLQRAGFLAGDHRAPTLRALHLVFAFLVIAFCGARLVDDWPILDSLTRYGILVVLVVVVVLGDPERSAGLTDDHRPVADKLWGLLRWARRLLFAAAGTVLLATCGRLLFSGSPAPVGERLMQFDLGAMVLLAYSLLALVVLFVTTLLLALRTRVKRGEDPRSFRSYAGGTTAYWVVSAGFFLGLGFSAAVAEGSAQVLQVEAKSAVLDRIAYAWGITVVLAAVMAIVIAGLFITRHCHRETHVAHMYERLEEGRGIPSNWARRVASAIGIARLKNCLTPILITFGIAAMALTAAAGHDAVGLQHAWRYLLLQDIDSSGDLPIWLRRLSHVSDEGQFDLLIWLGTWVLVIIAGRLVLLGRGAVTGQNTRRVVNTVWDVFCFWPHSVHPFAPPPYSTYVVLDVRDRILHDMGWSEHCESKGRSPLRPVVVAGHSQGSLIAFAALLWLTPEQRNHVGLVTFGSQLQVIFPRAFPSFVNYRTILALYDALKTRWVNLYRETDPLAGPVLAWTSARSPAGTYQSVSNPVDDRTDTYPDHQYGRRERGPDWRLLDPTPADSALQLAPIAKLRGHSDFPADPAWDDAVARARP
ncbi:hypothetical protein MPY17_13955 [Rhodococcus opacus]|uniref:hypothetical protein n=1 Tax=Rhodococcus opacus TaxID=37919 RepID=UPI001FF3DCC1|nr:hypothetical protein [Rhodococcus opacus]UOT06773.1 hypothetical protein MPY17_13955 [Rhodococcus opacus]